MRIGAFIMVLSLLGMEGVAFAQSTPEEDLSSPPLIKVPPPEDADVPPPPEPSPTPPEPVAIKAAPAPKPAPKTPPEPQKTKRIFSIQLAAGPTLQSLIGIPIYGADVSMLFGAQFPRLGIYGGPNAFFGRSEHGLAISEVRLMFHIHMRLQRFRLGGGTEYGFFTVDRRTNTGGMATISLGGHLGAMVDILQGEFGALFTGLKPFCYWVVGSGSPLIGGTWQVGWML